MFNQRVILAFLHIPKCAGTTLEHILRINYFMKHCEVQNFQGHSRKNLNKVFQAEDMKRVLVINPFIKSIAGHTVRPCDNLVKAFPNIRFITLLRNPVKRYISQYFYAVENAKTKFTFDDFLKNRHIFNRQTLAIAGSYNLSIAKELLDKRFFLVGTVEKFDEFLVILTKKLRPIQFKPFYKVQNVSKKNSWERKQIQAELCTYIDLIKERNKLDIELYNYVIKNIIPRERKDYGSELENDINEFKTQKNNSYRNWMRYIEYTYRKFYYNPIYSYIKTIRD